MNRAQNLIVLAAVTLAGVLGSLGLYASAQPGPYVQEPVAGSKLSGDEFLAPCTPGRDCSPDAPPAALQPDAARWWWLGAGTVLLLGASAVPLAGRRSRPGN